MKINIDHETLVHPERSANRALGYVPTIKTWNGTPSADKAAADAIIELAHGLASLTQQFNQLVELLNATN